MKRHRIGIVCCNSLYGELNNYNPKEAEVIIKPYRINCFSRKAEEVIRVIHHLSEFCEKVIVLISNCSSAIEREILKEGKVSIVKKDVCFEYLLPTSIVKEKIKEGKFIVHAAWVNEWETYVKEKMGLMEDSLAREFFQRDIKSFLVLETEQSKASKEKIEQLVSFTGIPVETKQLSSDYLHNFVNYQLLKVIIELEREKFVSKSARLLKETSDYRFAFEFFKNLHELQTEDEIILRTIELIKLLFDPKSVEYYRVSENKVLSIISEEGLRNLDEFLYDDRVNRLESEQINQILKTKLSEDSLLIPVKYRETVTDFIVVRNVKFKNFIEYYREFSDFFSHVLSIALSNVRKIRELTEAKIKADEASRAKSLFLSNMSHELRTPLTAIIGLSELLKDSSLNKEQIDLVDKIIHSSKLLLRLINDILDYSKIEAGELTLSQSEFSIDELISKLKILFEPKAAEKRINLYFDIDPQVPYSILGDELRLNQVLMNLLSNAVKFTEKGYVLLRVTLKEKIDEEHAIVKFLVEDTGIGISEEGLSKLFTPFTQADGTIERKYGGTGLGLAISQRLVQAMGSQIKVESKLGKGSKFYFEIPFTVIKWRPTLDDKVVGNLRILIVDDDEITRNVLRNYISRYNLGSCDEAEYGYEVIKKVLDANSQDINYDIVFLDWFLPDMNADEVIKSLNELHRKGKLKNLPRELIMISASERRSLNIDPSTVRYFIQKPITSSSIMDVLSAIHPSFVKKQETPREITTFTGVRILLAEDNPINQEVIRRILEKVGISVDIAWNGAQAVENLKEAKQKYDLILMDINMPELDGYGATEKIRKIDSQIPIIALTAAATEDDRERALKVGMNDFVTKPIESSELYRKLAEYLPNKAIVRKELPQEDSPRIHRGDELSVSEKIVDVDSLYQLFEEEGKVLSILEKFLNQLTDGYYRDIIEQLRSGTEQSKRMIHTLKGASGMAKANLLFTLTNRIYEKLNSSQRISEDDIEDLRRAMKSTVDFISGILESKKRTTTVELNENDFNQLRDRVITNLMSFSPVDDDELNIFVSELKRRGILSESDAEQFKKHVENFDYVFAINLIKKSIVSLDE